MPSPGAGGVQTSLVGTVQGMMASARAAFRRTPAPVQSDVLSILTPLNSLCFGGALPPSKLSYRLVRIATRLIPFSGIKAGHGGDKPMTPLV
jgi:hypothetical protein